MTENIIFLAYKFCYKHFWQEYTLTTAGTHGAIEKIYFVLQMRYGRTKKQNSLLVLHWIKSYCNFRRKSSRNHIFNFVFVNTTETVERDKSNTNDYDLENNEQSSSFPPPLQMWVKIFQSIVIHNDDEKRKANDRFTALIR